MFTCFHSRSIKLPKGYVRKYTNIRFGLLNDFTHICNVAECPDMLYFWLMNPIFRNHQSE